VEEANAYRNRAPAGGRITGASPSVTNAVGKKLEDIIESDPAMLGEALMILGRQVKTDSGKVIDLVGIEPCKLTRSAKTPLMTGCRRS
jgi:hypothetical protein